MTSTFESSTFESSTFETHLDRLDLLQVALDAGLSRDDVVTEIRSVDAAVAAIEGHGFEPTPFGVEAELAVAAELPEGVELWVKNETGNVSGSHKARHLFGVAVAHELFDAASSDAPFVIASCGNAALGAAVVAAAVEHPIEVFVPRWANEAVVDRIESLGGSVVRCDREEGVLGDPAHHAMVAAIAAGAIPFSCQGTETPLTVDGGRTLAFEMLDTLGDRRLDRLFIQVGGGALGSAVVTGLRRGLDDSDLPIVHAVQPVGNHPLVVAWDRLVADLGAAHDVPETNEERGLAAAALGRLGGEALASAMDRCRTDPSRYMGPWPHEPASYATGILDDVTYDWLELVEAMLVTGGFPIVASENQLQTAHRLAHLHTDIPVCPTGAAGLGGLLTLEADVAGTVRPDEKVAVIFSGHMRLGDPDPLS